MIEANTSRSAPGDLVVPFPSLMIKPVSSACNLRCRYCYYRGEGGEEGADPPRFPAGRKTRAMSDQVLRAALPEYAALAERPVVAWQGGEPLLAGRRHFETAVDLLARGRPAGREIRLSLQTNGFLLDRAWCRFLRENGFLVGLSLDGPPEIHDEYRLTAEGRGTFARVRRAVDLLREERVEFNVLAVVTPAAAARARDLYRFLRGLGLRHLQFIPCFTVPGKAPGDPPSLGAREYRDFLLEILKAWEEEGDLGVHVQLIDQALLAFFGRRPDFCFFQPACTALTLEAGGNLYPCDFFVEPEFRLGNVLETPFRDLLQGEAFLRFIRRTAEIPAACRACRWREICHGGCARQRFERRREFADENPACEALRAFFEASFDALTRMFGDRPIFAFGEAAGASSNSRNGAPFSA